MDEVDECITRLSASKMLILLPEKQNLVYSMRLQNKQNKFSFKRDEIRFPVVEKEISIFKVIEFC